MVSETAICVCTLPILIDKNNRFAKIILEVSWVGEKMGTLSKSLLILLCCLAIVVLLTFIVSHGILELSIIVASCFAGLIFSRIFYMRPYKNFKTRMAKAGEEGFKILCGVLPWLLVAAFLEVFVSPFDYLDAPLKILLGILAGFYFWFWIFKRPKTKIT